MFDFGGVVTTSPFEAFARLEVERGLPGWFIRSVNATNPDDNAWARLERSELQPEGFASGVGGGGPNTLGHELDGRLVLERLLGRHPPTHGRRHRRLPARATRPPASQTTSRSARPGHLRTRWPRSTPSSIPCWNHACSACANRTLTFTSWLARRSAWQPEESVFLDDLGVNLKPARALGMHTIKVTDPDEALVEPSRKILGHPVVND